jgi:predicted choloylglycine hydrolase
MSNDGNAIGWLSAAGSPFEIGQALGARGRDAVHKHLVHSQIWSTITDERHAATVGRLMDNTKRRFPRIWQELNGLAEGLDLPKKNVLAWNCRGDILASVPDGCTTIQRPGPTISLAHNEDGLPFFRGSCSVLDARPDDAMGFRSFCYPGSLAGHTFGWNGAGIVMAVNNLRLTASAPQIPRMVLGRAVLNCRSLDEAVSILADDPACGGFHISLAQAGDRRLLSIEYGAGQISVRQIIQPSVHANHALHLPHPHQIITQSSHDRQNRGAELVSRPEKTDLAILRDNGETGLPIRRDDPADPDHENTLATCIFYVSETGIDWSIYGEKQSDPTYKSQNQRVQGTARVS